MIRAVVFDLDGVVTFTARVHAAAWKELFQGSRPRRRGVIDRQLHAEEEPFRARAGRRELAWLDATFSRLDSGPRSRNPGHRPGRGAK